MVDHDAPDTYDVVVLGTGAAGLTGALASHDQGASVGLFEKRDGRHAAGSMQVESD